MGTLFRFKLTFTSLMFNYQSIAFLNLKSLSYFIIAIQVKSPGISKIFPGPGPGLKSIKRAGICQDQDPGRSLIRGTTDSPGFGNLETTLSFINNFLTICSTSLRFLVLLDHNTVYIVPKRARLRIMAAD